MLASIAARKQLRILQDAKIVQIERKTKFIWIFLRCSHCNATLFENFFLAKKVVNILHKMKKYTKNFGNLRKSSYLCSQEQWTCSIYWDWGVPDRKSCQVRGDSFFYACWDG